MRRGRPSFPLRPFGAAGRYAGGLSASGGQERVAAEAGTVRRFQRVPTVRNWLRRGGTAFACAALIRCPAVLKRGGIRRDGFGRPSRNRIETACGPASERAPSTNADLREPAADAGDRIGGTRRDKGLVRLRRKPWRACCDPASPENVSWENPNSGRLHGLTE